jgi:hypothetical protein
LTQPPVEQIPELLLRGLLRLPESKVDQPASYSVKAKTACTGILFCFYFDRYMGVRSVLGCWGWMQTFIAVVEIIASHRNTNALRDKAIVLENCPDVARCEYHN